MNSLKISDFKGISQEIYFDIPDNANLAIYGDNGSGKTSVFEAIRLYYFGLDLINHTIPRNAIQAERDTIISNWLDSLKCRHGSGNFAIEIDSSPLDIDQSNTDQVLMLEGKYLARYDEISLNDLINISTVHGGSLPQWQTIAADIVDTVNFALQECFHEDLSVSLSSDDGTHIIIEDQNRHLRFWASLSAYFNESKIKLVRLLCFLAYALHAADIQGNKRPLLVLDDFVTSIDTSNRICLVKFIFDNFRKFQIILMTHNVSFFNLIAYMANDYAPRSANWVFTNICCNNLVCRQYNHNLDDPISKIKTDFDNDPSDINGIANRLRRKFENMISELAQFTLADTHTETKELLQRLLTDSPIYINAGGNGINRADELVRRIQETCLHCQPNRLPGRIQTLINQYDRTEELKPIRDLIKTMKLYQKVILHQGSHSQPGIPTITTRELNLIFPLMSKLETSINELLRNANVYRM